MYILDADPSKPWTRSQAWLLITSLATSDTLRYNEILLSDIYKSGDSTLQALEQAELITIVSTNGRPRSIKPGKPVYQAAFKYLTQDRVLKARLDLVILAELIGVETKGIEKCEEELKLLAKLPKQPEELSGRVKWLLGKVWKAQERVERYEAEGGRLKNVLMGEY